MILNMSTRWFLAHSRTCKCEYTLLNTETNEPIHGFGGLFIHFWLVCWHSDFLVSLYRTLITGMVSGSIVAFNIDFNRWHYEHQNRYWEHTDAGKREGGEKRSPSYVTEHALSTKPDPADRRTSGMWRDVSSFTWAEANLIASQTGPIFPLVFVSYQSTSRTEASGSVIVAKRLKQNSIH